MVGAANQVVATPDGAAGLARPRALEVDDIPEGVGGGVSNLVDLEDVSLTGLAANDVIRYDGANFVNIKKIELFKTSQEVHLGQHPIVNGGAPTVSLGSAAGSGGDPGVSTFGKDAGGQINATTGSGSLGTGEFIIVTYDNAFADSTTGVPLVTPANANAAGKKFYVDNASSDGFSIFLAEAPEASTQYLYNFHVLGNEV